MNFFPLDDHYVALNTQLDQIWVIDAIAHRIWRKHLAGEDNGTIAKGLAEEFDAPMAQIEDDVVRVLRTDSTDTELIRSESNDYYPDDRYVPMRDIKQFATAEYHLGGIRFNLLTETPELLEYLNELMSFAVPTPSPKASSKLLVYEDGGRCPIVHEGSARDTGVSLTDTAIKCMREMFAIAASYEPWAMVFHAAAVARGDQGVLIPAMGGSGKTTLTAYLISRDFKLLNDDAVPLLVANSKLLPVPIPLSIKSGSWQVLAPYYPKLKDLREYGNDVLRIKYLSPQPSQIRTDPCACSVLLLPTFHHDADIKPRTETVSKLEVVMNLVQGGSYMSKPMQSAAVAVFVDWLKQVSCYRIHYHHLADAHKLISDLLDNGSR